MEFAIMVWRSKFGGMSSIYGALDPAKPGLLPTLGRGHWAELRRLKEERFPQAEAARQAIAEQGFYMFGSNVDVTESEGSQPPG
jgi:hypothetical protein